MSLMRKRIPEGLGLAAISPMTRLTAFGAIVTAMVPVVKAATPYLKPIVKPVIEGYLKSVIGKED